MGTVPGGGGRLGVQEHGEVLAGLGGADEHQVPLGQPDPRRLCRPERYRRRPVTGCGQRCRHDLLRREAVGLPHLVRDALRRADHDQATPGDGPPEQAVVAERGGPDGRRVGEEGEVVDRDHGGGAAGWGDKVGPVEHVAPPGHHLDPRHVAAFPGQPERACGQPPQGAGRARDPRRRAADGERDQVRRAVPQGRVAHQCRHQLAAVGRDPRGGLEHRGRVEGHAHVRHLRPGLLRSACVPGDDGTRGHRVPLTPNSPSRAGPRDRLPEGVP